MENSGIVRLSNVDDLGQRRESPDRELVVGETVRGENFAAVRIEAE